MALKEAPQLRFQGAPPLVSLIEEMSHPLLKPGSYRFELGGNQAVLSVRPVASVPTKYSLFRLRIPKSTPPGTYLSRFIVDGDEVPVAVEVEARNDLRFVPASLSVTVAPGETVESTVTVANTGNAELRIAKEDTFCVFNTSGIDRAFFSALTDQRTRGTERLERFLEQLSDSHGGLVRLRVNDGPVNIPPAEALKIQVQLECSRRLRPGLRYSGAWALLDFRYSIELHVIEPKKKGTK